MITEEQILEPPLSPNQGVLLCMDESGDTKVVWDRNNRDEVEAARHTFNALKKKGHLAYEVKGKDGSKGEVIEEFDPEAERLILAPRVVGG